MGMLMEFKIRLVNKMSQTHSRARYLIRSGDYSATGIVDSNNNIISESYSGNAGDEVNVRIRMYGIEPIEFIAQADYLSDDATVITNDDFIMLGYPFCVSRQYIRFLK